MINSINAYCPYNTNFRGINPKTVTTPAKKGANMLDELIKKMVKELKAKINPEDVPQFGEFTPIWTEFENKDKTITANHCLLKISPTFVKGSENNRFLEVAALRDDSPYGAEIVIGYGSTNDIINKLNEQGIEQVIKEKFIHLSKSLESI